MRPGRILDGENGGAYQDQKCIRRQDNNTVSLSYLEEIWQQLAMPQMLCSSNAKHP